MSMVLSTVSCHCFVVYIYSDKAKKVCVQKQLVELKHRKYNQTQLKFLSG